MPLSRREALDKLYGGLTCNEFIEYYDVGDVNGMDAHETISLICEIYDDFESSTCENCIYHTESNLVCDARIGRPSEHEIHFGCNKFERE